MRKIFTTKKRILIAGAAGALILGTGGAAFAYFSATGTGTGQASVGAGGSWSVGPGTSATALLPGATEDVTFTVTNPAGNQPQEINPSDVSPTIPVVTSDNDVYQNTSKTDVPNWADATNCYETWFSYGTPTITYPSGTITNNEIPAGESVTVTVPVTMKDSTDNQDACENIAGPEVTISIK